MDVSVLYPQPHGLFTSHTLVSSRVAVLVSTFLYRLLPSIDGRFEMYIVIQHHLRFDSLLCYILTLLQF